MSNLGVFSWIRESVRRSVLLGFSDAVEQLGVAASADEPLHPQLAAVLHESAPRAFMHAPAEGRSSHSKPKRKRLGRSLEQLRNPPAPKTADGAA